MLANQEIRNAMRTNGVKQWEVAEAMGICESVLCRKLRREVSEEEANEIMNAIDQVRSEGVVNG